MAYIPGTVERIIEATIGDVDKVVLNAPTLGELRRIHEVRRAELARPCLLVRVRVDRDDARRLDERGRRDDAEADGAAAEDGDGRALCGR